jgi:hypothetical protein
MQQARQTRSPKYYYVQSKSTTLHSVNLPFPLGLPRFQDSSLDQAHSLHLDSATLTALGCKGWCGTLSNGLTIFAKLWDGWKFYPQGSEHEASVYNRLRELWGTTVPEFFGLGNWGFCHILLLSYIEVPLSSRVQR